MNKFIFVFCLLCWAGVSVYAQSNTTASGGGATGAGGSSSYSVGQIDFATIKSAGGSLTEGVQQPFEILVTSLANPELEDFDVTVFPNPTRGHLEILTDNTELHPMHCQLFDVTGSIVYSDTVNDTKTTIDMSPLPGGLYFLKITNGARMTTVVQVVKIQ